MALQQLPPHVLQRCEIYGAHSRAFDSMKMMECPAFPTFIFSFQLSNFFILNVKLFKDLFQRFFEIWIKFRVGGQNLEQNNTAASWSV